MTSTDRFQDNVSPFVGCFKVGSSSYIYDVNTNEILKVDSSVFVAVVDSIESPERCEETLSTPSIRALRDRGYLSSHRPKGVKGSCSDCLKKGQQSKIMQVTLELTQACNHRCMYCPYSAGNPERRFHSTQSMEEKTAFAAIDLLFENSKDVELPALGFYGGEPLLEWDILKNCLDHSRSKAAGRKYILTITTNATLITREIAQVLAGNRVAVLVSLDGPEETHNLFRRFRSGTESAYSSTLRGLGHLRTAYGDDATSKIRINAVCGPWTDYLLLEDFFSINPPPEIIGLQYQFSEVNHPAISSISSGEEVADSDSIQRKGEYFQRWAELLDNNNLDNAEGMFLGQLFKAPVSKFHTRPRTRLSNYLGPMGMCDPGARKCYVDINGEIILCERVHESFVIGNVHEGGIDLGKGMAILDGISEAFNERCPECIFCRICTGCPAIYGEADGSLSVESIEAHCSSQAQALSNQMIWYVSALESNPDCFVSFEGDSAAK